MQGQPLRTVKKHGHLRAVATQNRVQLFDARADSHHELHQPAGPLIPCINPGNFITTQNSFFSPSGKYLALTGGGGCSVRLHVLSPVYRTHVLWTGIEGGCARAAAFFGPDEQYLLSMRARSFEIWNCETGLLVSEVAALPAPLAASNSLDLHAAGRVNSSTLACCFSPDFTRLFAAPCRRGLICVYDVEHPTIERGAAPSSAAAAAAAASESSSASDNDGGLLPVIGGADPPPFNLRFRTFLSTGWDAHQCTESTLSQPWDVALRHLFANHMLGDAAVDSLCVSPDGRHLFAVSQSPRAISCFDVSRPLPPPLFRSFRPEHVFSAPSQNDGESAFSSPVPLACQLVERLMWRTSIERECPEITSRTLMHAMSSAFRLVPSFGGGAAFCAGAYGQRCVAQTFFRDANGDLYDYDEDSLPPNTSEDDLIVAPTYFFVPHAVCGAILPKASAMVPGLFAFSPLPPSQQPADNRRQLALASVPGSAQISILDVTQPAQPRTLALHAGSAAIGCTINCAEMCPTGDDDDDDETAFQFVLHQFHVEPILSWMTRERRLHGREDVIFLNGELVEMHFSEEAPADGEEKAAVLLRCMLADGAQEVFKLSDEARDLYLSS